MSKKPIDFRTKKVTIDTKKVFDVINARNKNPHDKMTATKFADLMQMSSQTFTLYKNVDVPDGIKAIMQMVHLTGMRIEDFIIVKNKSRIQIPKKKKDE